MKFLFNVNINDKDYLEFNSFCMFRSPYGKSQTKTFRIIIAVLFAIVIIIPLFREGFSKESILGIVPDAIGLTFLQIFLNNIILWAIKGYIKTSRKYGKLAYSPTSLIEFYDEVFVETTPENKIEQKYSSIERISVVDNKSIYIHVNNSMAFILPLSCFESKEQYDSFINFISTKCANVDVY